jgi:predicted DNA-binding protein (MmcQ/YjbR family)
VDSRQLKERCLALPGAMEEFPFGDEVSVFKVGGKMFALCPLDGEPLQLSIKCDPEFAVQLRASYPAVAPGYHRNKRHWNTITLDGSVLWYASSDADCCPTGRASTSSYWDGRAFHPGRTIVR